MLAATGCRTEIAYEELPSLPTTSKLPQQVMVRLKTEERFMTTNDLKANPSAALLLLAKVFLTPSSADAPVSLSEKGLDPG